jgi:hypothetical protein
MRLRWTAGHVKRPKPSGLEDGHAVGYKSATVLPRVGHIKFVLRRERYWSSKLDSLLPGSVLPTGE